MTVIHSQTRSIMYSQKKEEICAQQLLESRVITLQYNASNQHAPATQPPDKHIDFHCRYPSTSVATALNLPSHRLTLVGIRQFSYVATLPKVGCPAKMTQKQFDQSGKN